ncbi:MAG: 50S ribosomal protein L29 [Patescibacteria group bacterium]
MRISELRNKSEDELKRLLTELREGLRQTRFDIQLKQSKNVREIRKIKKDIAKILTLLNEK